MDIELYIPLDVGTINSDVPQVTEEAGKGENAYADLWKQCCADHEARVCDTRFIQYHLVQFRDCLRIHAKPQQPKLKLLCRQPRTAKSIQKNARMFPE